MINIIKNILKTLRKEKGVTQNEVAEAINVDRVSYTRYENGTRTPTSEIILSLAKYFNCTTDYLLGNTDSRNENLTLTDDEREFLDVYLKAKKSDKQSVKDMLKIIDNILDGHE